MPRAARMSPAVAIPGPGPMPHPRSEGRRLAPECTRITARARQGVNENYDIFGISLRMIASLTYAKAISSFKNNDLETSQKDSEFCVVEINAENVAAQHEI
jgi:hypothetical protein